MFPARFAPILFGLILSGIMSCIVSGIATLRVIGLSEAALGAWLASWSFSWPIAFCVVLVVAPFTRRIVARLIRTKG